MPWFIIFSNSVFFCYELFLSLVDKAQKYIKVGNMGELIELLREKPQAKSRRDCTSRQTTDDPYTELQSFDNQHELPKMNHELIHEKFMDNSWSIHVYKELMRFVPQERQ